MKTLLLFFILLAVSTLSMLLGPKTIELVEVFNALTDPKVNDFDATILWDLRLPRTLSAILVGAALSVAGLAIQVLTKNRLADSTVLGLSSGASFALVVSAFGLSVGVVGQAALAFFGAVGSSLIVFFLSFTKKGPDPMRMVIAGLIVSGFLGSITGAVLILNIEEMDKIRFWIVGSLSGKPLETVLGFTPAILLPSLCLASFGRWFEIMLLGDEKAKSLGMNLVFTKTLIMVLLVIAVGSSVALAGPIAFVGLIVPNLASKLFGTHHRSTAPRVALLGSILLVCADLLGRVVMSPIEISGGVVMGIMGSLSLLTMARSKGELAK